MSRAFVVVGLAFGDEGKGTITDALTRNFDASIVVRFNGGAQAGHNVVLPDGRHHVFSQFGSGTFAGARTHLSRFMMVNPRTMLNEAEKLDSLRIPQPLSLVTIEREALVTTPLHVAINRIRELVRGDGAHGSCGMGIGETAAYALAHPDDALKVGDLSDAVTVRRKLGLLRDQFRDESSAIASHAPGPSASRSRGDTWLAWKAAWNAIHGGDWDTTEVLQHFVSRVEVVDRTWLPAAMVDQTTIFEGAQGVLLDEDYGFHPHTTWSKCTTVNADELIEDFAGDTTTIGILRAFSTRHGAGPFPVGGSYPDLLRGEHNAEQQFQGRFRVGPLDLVLAQYAGRTVDEVGYLDGIAVTCMDRVDARTVTICKSYDTGARIDGDSLMGDRLSMLPWMYAPSLERQQRLGAALVTMRPVLDSIRTSELIERIEQVMGRDVLMTSHGPTYLDKKWHWP